MTLNDLTSQNILSHASYQPGEQPDLGHKVIKLNTNENPYPPTPRASEKILDHVNKLMLYPNSSSINLRRTIAKIHMVDEDQVIVGNGSDDILNLCVRCFSDQTKPVGFLEPSYSLYEVLASLQGAPIDKILFRDPTFEIDPDLISASNSNIFFITSPHAPSGRTYQNVLFSSILENYNGILVVDEAYADFASENAVKLLNENNRLVITRTLSKSYSLAGLRVGYGLASKEIISVLNKAREVYNVDCLAQYIAQVSLEDQNYFRHNVNKIISLRDRLNDQFKMWKWHTYKSGANFLFTCPVDSFGNKGKTVAKNAFEFLKNNQIFVRYFPLHSLTSSYLRISIGKEEEMDILLETLKKWQKKEQSK